MIMYFIHSDTRSMQSKVIATLLFMLRLKKAVSYISFESNLNLIKLAPQILAILKPASFDLLAFNASHFHQTALDYIPNGYVSLSLVQSELTNGYLVSFANFIKPQKHFSSAKVIDINVENHAL